MASVKEKARALVAAKMQPMALTKAERKAQDAPMAGIGPSRGEVFPWGLTLTLEDVVMKKLKLRTDLKAGQQVVLAGVAKVKRCEETEDESGARCSCTIQITKLALTPSGSAKASKGKDADD